VERTNDINRRSVLKAIGSGAAVTTLASGAVGAASNKDSNDPILQASLTLMQKTKRKEKKKLNNKQKNGNLKESRLLSELGVSPKSQVGNYLNSNPEALVSRAATERGINKRVKFLNKHNRHAQFSSKHNLSRYQKESDSGGFSTQYISEDEISCWIVTGYSSYNGADEWVDCNYSISGNGGDNPEDVVSIAWPSGDFDLVENGAYKHNMNAGSLKSSSFDSAVWNFADGRACGITCDLEFTVGGHLERLATQGKFETTYQHGYGGCGSLSVSVSYGNVSVTPTCGKSSVEQQLRDVEQF